MTQDDSPSASHRSRPLRVEESDRFYFVTTRTLGEHFWLHPALTSNLSAKCRHAQRALDAQRARLDRRIGRHVDRVNKRMPEAARPLSVTEFKRSAAGLVTSALARAQAATAGADGAGKVEIYAVVVMSNHVHLVLRTPGCNLAKFMCIFKKRLTDGINRLLGRRGSLFARRYDAQPILNEAAVRERIGYALSNPRKAGLVDDHQQWPGFIAAAGMLDCGDGDECEAEYFDATAWHKAGAPDDCEPFWRTLTLTLSRVAQDEDTPVEDYVADVQGWARDAKWARDPKWAARKQKRVVGLDAIVGADFDKRPLRPSRSRRPYAFGTAEEKSDLRKAMDVIVSAYAECMQRWFGGVELQNLQWPPGTYPPGVPIAA